MENLSNAAKAALNSYSKEQYQKIQALQLPNARRFFVEDTDPESFIEQLEDVKTFVYQAFMLLHEDYKPDGEGFYNVLYSIDCFIGALKLDVNCVDEKQAAIEVASSELYKELYNELYQNWQKKCREVGGLEYTLGLLNYNREYFLRLHSIANLFMSGYISEESTVQNFIKETKRLWQIEPKENPEAPTEEN